MKRFGFFECYFCGTLQFSDMSQRTHRCPKPGCRHILQLSRVVVHAETDDLTKAISYLQKLKLKKGVKHTGLFVTADEMLQTAR